MSFDPHQPAVPSQAASPPNHPPVSQCPPTATAAQAPSGASQTTLPTTPCPRCNSIERHADGCCAPCSRDRARKWRADHPKRARELNAKWFADHADYKRQYNRQRYHEKVNG
jgi:hypothetical protein